MVRARRAAVGGRMRELRKQAGLTQEAVAGAAGPTRQFYLVVEAGAADSVAGQRVRDR